MHKWLVLVAICCLFFMFNVDYTATNLALAPIANELHSNMADLQWILNGYSLAIGCLFLFSARFSDLVGKHRIYFLGAWLFLISTFLCGASNSMNELIFARILQGASAGLAFSIAMILVFQTFPKSQRGTAVGITSACMGLGQAFGPSYGGMVIHYLNWHWIFYLTLPFIIFSITIIWLCPRPAHPIFKKADLKSFDWLGGFLLSLFIVLYCYPLNIAIKLGFTSVYVWLLLSAAFVTLGFLAAHEKKQRNPLFHLEALQNKFIIKYVVMRFFFQWAVYVLPFIAALYCQNVLSYSALKTGNLLLIGIVFYVVVSPLAGKYFEALGRETMCAIGFAILELSCFAFITFSYQPLVSILIIALILFGIGFGVLQPCMSMGVLHYSKPDISTTAVGLSLTIAILGGLTGVAMTGFCYATFSQIIFTNHIGSVLFNQLQTTYPTLINIIHGSQGILQIQNIIPRASLAFTITVNVANSLMLSMRAIMIAQAIILFMTFAYALKRIKN